MIHSTPSFAEGRSGPSNFKSSVIITQSKNIFYGLASWYKQGIRTASGEKFNTNDLTIAHRTLPFGTKVLLTNMKNNATVIARVNDRGPFISNRVVDTSYKVATILGFVANGTAQLKIEVIND